MAALTSTALAMPSFYEAPAANITFKSTFVGVCNRTALLETADAYIAAQAAGSLTGLTPLFAPGFFYVENNKELAITSSPVLKKKLPIDSRRTITDMLQCATYTELISASDAANPYVIGTQIRHADTPAGEPLRIVSIDTIASTTGSWLFNAKNTLQYAKQESWTVIPESKWDPRDVIQAAGDHYMDLWSSSTAEAKIPWGTPCARLEGGAYTGRGQPTDSCKAGVPSNHNQAPNTNRRYVIDQSMGSVSIFCVWEHMMMAADSHEFRLENGKLRFIHTMTECGGRTCRL